MNNPTTLDLVRHGEIATRGLLCAGPTEPLSTRGQGQMNALGAGIKWDLIVSSPYTRCCETAKDLAHQLDLPLNIDPAWQEIDFGAWTDRRRDALWASDEGKLQKLWANPLSFTAPDGESMLDFVARIETSCNRLLQAHPGKSILLLTHAGVIRAVLARALGIDYRDTQKFSIAHGKVNRLRAYPDGEFSLQNWACSVTDLD